MRWLARLDTYGTGDPGFNEGHPEDRCPVCDWPVSDHPAAAHSTTLAAKWPHRWHALIAILLNR